MGFATVSGQTLPIYLTETNGQWSAPAFLDQPTGDETPEAISCWSAGECVAVGYSYSQNSGHTNAISYRISQGTITKAVLPDAGVANSDATSVSCWGPEHCVAVGALFPTIGATKATAFRYDASAGWTGPFTLSSSVTDSFTYSRIQSISCLSDGTCQTVGAVGSPPPVSSRRAGAILRIQGVHATFDSSGWNNVALLDGNGTAAVTDPTDVSCWTSESCVAIGSTGAFGVGAPRRGTPRNVELLPANNVHGISWGQAGGQWGSIGVSSTFKYFNGISCVGGTCTVVGINNSGVVVSLMTTLLTFTSTSLPNASLGSGYHQPIATLGGEGIVTVAQTGGTLPRGISFDPATGALQGTATEMGTFTFTLTASSTGNLPQTASFTYTLVVGPALAATGLNLPLLFGSGMFLLAIGVYLRRRFGRIA